MRRIFIGLVLTLVALPAWAQTQQQIDWCKSPTATDDQTIEGCTATIQSGHYTGIYLSEFYDDRGFAYTNKGLYDQAFTDLNQALALNPNNAAAHNNRAWAYHMKGEDARGLPDAEKAVALAPNDAASIETRGEIYEKLGQRDKAIADYRAALNLVPNMKEAQAGLKRLGVTP